MNKNHTPGYVLNSPELGKPFQLCYQACKEDGVLDKKTKELIATALSSLCGCPRYTEIRIKEAMKAGVSREEITEALLIAAVEVPGARLKWQEEYRHNCLATEQQNASEK